MNFENIIGPLIPIAALSIPIIKIMSNHQQRMTEIIHNTQGQNGQLHAEMDSMKREITSLKELVHQQTIALDTLQNGPRVTPPQIVDLESRLNQ